MAKKKTVQVAAQKDKPSIDAPLTWREERFVDYYIRNGGNASAAYREAHPGVSTLTSQTEGPKLLGKPRVSDAISLERDRLKNIGRVAREEMIRVLVAMALTTPDEVSPALRTPSQQDAYTGLGDKRYALHVQKTPEGYFASTPTNSERRAAINDLWEKLGLDKDTGEDDRISFLERFASMGKRLGRAGPEEGSQ